MYNLKKLDVSYNKISNMSEFDALKTLVAVTELKVTGNKFNTIIPDPKRLIIYLVPSIKKLDGVKISAMERVCSALSTYNQTAVCFYLKKKKCCFCISSYICMCIFKSYSKSIVFKLQ